MTAAWQQLRVRRCAPLAEGILGLELEAPDRAPLPAWEAGAHVDLELPNGMVRQYSLLGSDADRSVYELAILLEPQGRGGSQSAHRDIRAGMSLRVGLPRNLFPLVPAAHSVLMAGGIGITPMLAMAERLSREGASFELHYCGRTRARMAFIERIAGSAFAHCVHVHVDDESAAQRLNAVALLAGPTAHRHLYVCGPRGFMDHVLDTARTFGWAQTNLHHEYFGQQPADNSADQPFELRLAKSGRAITVCAGQTVVDALAQAGVAVPVSCEQGVCGTCVLRVVEGRPLHRDLYFTDAERAKDDQFTPCCSRAATPFLTVDL